MSFLDNIMGEFKKLTTPRFHRLELNVFRRNEACRYVQEDANGMYSNHSIVQGIATQFAPYVHPVVYRHTFTQTVPKEFPHYFIHVQSDAEKVAGSITHFRQFLAQGQAKTTHKPHDWCLTNVSSYAQGKYGFGDFTFSRHAAQKYPEENYNVRLSIFSAPLVIGKAAPLGKISSCVADGGMYVGKK